MAPLLVAGLGGGMVIAPNITLTLQAVPVVMAGAAGGALQTAQRIGAAIGTTMLATVLPAGAAISAGFAFRRFRARGATSAAATDVTILSGLLSVAALGLLAAAAGLAVLSERYPLAAAGTAIAFIAAVARLLRRRDHPKTPHPPHAPLPAWLARLTHRWRPLGRAFDAVGEAAGAATNVRAVDWLAAGAFTVLNWVVDLLCLYAATAAVGLSLPLLAVTWGYLAVQVLRQVPITPGGVGVVETSLLVALVSAGSANAAAAAAVLVYRTFSYWLIVAIGLVAWTVLQATGRQAG